MSHNTAEESATIEIDVPTKISIASHWGTNSRFLDDPIPPPSVRFEK